MKALLTLFLAGGAMLLLARNEAAADSWARVDGPWSQQELEKSIAYCRLVPRVRNEIPVFIDLVHGQEINKCMRALGWIGLAR
jgi:hypothetical protein